jgi:hypothetical protein
MKRTNRIVLALAISLISAAFACSIFTSTAQVLYPDRRICPLSDEQSEKSIQAFVKLANVFTTEPRCVNCHGAIDPFGVDANKTHGGGKLSPAMTTETDENGAPIRDDKATFQQCQHCHGAFQGWRTPPSDFLFVGKDAFELCKLEKARFDTAEQFIDHIEHDLIIEEAFTGRMGLRLTGDMKSLVAKYPAPPQGVTHQELNQMARDWVDAQGGKFQGGYECGCTKHHYAIHLTDSGVSDRVFASGSHSHAEISGQGDISLTFKDDGSFGGEATLSQSFAESLTRPIEVCSGKGSFSKQMKVTGNIEDPGNGGDSTMHVKFSWTHGGAVSGTCTGKGVTIPFSKNRPGINSADVKSPLTDGFDMPAKVDETLDIPYAAGADKSFKFKTVIETKKND